MANIDSNVLATKPAWSIPRLMDDFDLSRSKVYAMIADGIFIARKEGAKTLIDGNTVRHWYGNLPPANIKRSEPQQAAA